MSDSQHPSTDSNIPMNEHTGEDVPTTSGYNDTVDHNTPPAHEGEYEDDDVEYVTQHDENGAVRRKPYNLNYFRWAFGFAGLCYLIMQAVLYTRTYVYLDPRVSLSKPYGALLMWNALKPLVLVFIVYCCIRVSIPMWMAVGFSGFTAAMALGSLAFFIAMIRDVIFIANQPLTPADHPSNDKLFCCAFFDVNPDCTFRGPCLNVSVSAYNLPLGQPGTYIDITRDDLHVNPVFMEAIFVFMTILIFEILLLVGFAFILRSLKKGKGLFQDAYILLQINSYKWTKNHFRKPPPRLPYELILRKKGSEYGRPENFQPGGEYYDRDGVQQSPISGRTRWMNDDNENSDSDGNDSAEASCNGYGPKIKSPKLVDCTDPPKHLAKGIGGHLSNAWNGFRQSIYLIFASTSADIPVADGSESTARSFYKGKKKKRIHTQQYRPRPQPQPPMQQQYQQQYQQPLVQLPVSPPPYDQDSQARQRRNNGGSGFTEPTYDIQRQYKQDNGEVEQVDEFSSIFSGQF